MGIVHVARGRTGHSPAQQQRTIERLVLLAPMPPPPESDSSDPVALPAAVTPELVASPTPPSAPARNADIVPARADTPSSTAPEPVKPLVATALDHLSAAPLPAPQVDESAREARVVRTRAVEPAGFGSAVPAARTAPATRSDLVRLAGFDIAPPAPPSAAPAAPRPTPIDRPVEIVIKPAPAYTDEAKALKVEGTVTLDVEFASSGEVHVLRVIQGLGHGLDEAASRAAERIRFRPAQSDGRDVDYRATVYIMFRLS